MMRLVLLRLVTEVISVGVAAGITIYVLLLAVALGSSLVRGLRNGSSEIDADSVSLGELWELRSVLGRHATIFALGGACVVVLAQLIAIISTAFSIQNDSGRRLPDRYGRPSRPLLSGPALVGPRSDPPTN